MSTVANIKGSIRQSGSTITLRDGEVGTVTIAVASQTAPRTFNFPQVPGDATLLFDNAPNITGGTHDFGLASSGSQIVLPKDTAANLAALARKEAAIYYDTDSNYLVVDDGVSLSPIIGGSGEINTGSSLGAGEGTVFKQKVGSNLEFRSVRAGTDITITQDANEITINSTVIPGESNTASNVGATGFGVFKQKTGIDLEFKKIVAGTNITISNPDADTIEITASGGGSGDLLAANNLSDVASASTSLANLGGEPIITAGTTSQYYRGDKTFQDLATAVAATAAVTANTSKVSADGSIATHSDVDLTGIADGLILKWVAANSRFEPAADGGGGSSIIVEDEGTPLTTAVTKFNFAGAGVTVTEPVADEMLITIPGGGGGGSWTSSYRTANYTASTDDEVHADTDGGQWTLTLPANPSLGDRVRVIDPTDNWSTTNLIVDRNNSTINGLLENVNLDLAGAWAEFIYTDNGVSGDTWLLDVISTAGVGGPITVEDEGTPLTTALAKLNFAGAGVTVTEPVANEMLVTIPGGGGGSSWTTSIKTFADAGYTASDYDEVFTDTTGGAWTLNLPASPTIGQRVRVLDGKDNWATANLTVQPESGGRINGGTIDDPLVCDVSGAWVEFIYMDATEGWRTRNG